MEDDTASRVVRICLRAAAQVNKVFVIITAGVRVLILPQISPYQWWVCMLYGLQVCCSDLFLIMIVKTLQVQFQIENFLLLLSFGSTLPFAYSVYKLWFFIPCPPMASVVSNLSLGFAFCFFCALGFGTFGAAEGAFWRIYLYVMTIWPWLVLASAVARLYVERNIKKNPFSPVRELPVMGLMSSFILVLMLMPAKNITLSDCLVLTCIDPILAAGLASFILGKARRNLHFKSMKMYTLIIILVVAYAYGDAYSGAGLGSDHFMFIVARMLVVVRSMWVKSQYASFHNTKAPARPPENALLFFESHKPKKHRFKQFPAPLLLTLDAIFDSGLRDTDFHAMGPVGTRDLYMLTESTYLLPISSLMTYLFEQDTIATGLIPPAQMVDQAQAAVDAIGLSSTESSAFVVDERVTATGTLIVMFLCLSFCAARAATPWVASKSLFDWGSTVHSWKYQPILIALPFFIYDILFLNGALSKFQIVAIMLLLAINALHRVDIWNTFKRKFLLLMTQDLHYHQPAVLRQLQRRTLLEFLEKTSTDDYSMILLDTAIRHGGNIRELARDTSITVWDPAPSATAAWKLAFSLVTKSLKRQKMAHKQKKEARESVEAFIASLVVNVVYKAVDAAEGHGSRLRLAGSLASVMSKRRALRRLQAQAEHRRLMRKRRQAGQLAHVPSMMAAADGKLRSIRDITAQNQHTQQVALMEPSQGMLALPSPGQAETTSRSQGSRSQGTNAHLQMSLNASQRSRASGDSEDAPLLDLPGGFGPASDAETPGGRSGAIIRGVLATADMLEDASSPFGAVVISFGDATYGQLGVSADKKVTSRRIIPIAELRGVNPVQVEAAGVASFVVGNKGQMWSFGSNRSMELGLRKEVTQVNVPQRTKAIREEDAVQVAGSPSASGQAHTLVLTNSGQVYTFGTSSCGALGQGPDVRQTAPLLLRMTSEVRIRTVAAGARHSVLISDEGKIFTMGDNTHGQLGFAKTKCRIMSEPEPIEGQLGQACVQLISAGDDHTLATTEDGKLFAWGSNANGQLGLGRLDDQDTPKAVEALTDLGVTSMACGARHSLVVARRGKQVWSFGSNVQGQLGVGPNTTGNGMQLSSPALIHTLSGHRDIEVTQVAAASCHSLALARSGEVYAFGENSYGQLGFPPAGAGLQSAKLARSVQQRKKAEIDAPYMHAEGVANLWLPTRVLPLGLYRVRSVATADMHTLALAVT